ncbi:MAG: hypothetical protein ACOCZL_02330 [Bacteroidota bacterium]
MQSRYGLRKLIPMEFFNPMPCFGAYRLAVISKSISHRLGRDPTPTAATMCIF